MNKLSCCYVRYCKTLSKISNVMKTSHRSFYKHFTKKDETSLDQLKNIYKLKLLPLEKRYLYHEFHLPPLTDQDFDAKPMVLFVGQYSTGKTTMIKYLIEKDYPGIRIGPEPTTDKFTVIMGGDKEQYIPGNALVADPSKQFNDLSRFGNKFLTKLQCAIVDSPLLNCISFVDTPGILSGEKQRSQREYNFNNTLNWFAERSDMIILTFDANKLDISDELKAAIDILKAHDSKLRIVLNKADTIEERAFHRVHGALMWALGKTIDCPEVPRVYVGSFWDRPYKNDNYRIMFNEEENDLFQDMKSLPQYSIVSKLNHIGKRAKSVIVHAYIISELKSRMPLLSKVIKRKNYQNEIINNLENVYNDIQVKYKNISLGDFPDVEQMKVVLKNRDFSSFKSLDEKLINRATNLLDGLNIDIAVNEIEVKSNIILNKVDNSSPFNVKTDGIHEGKFEQGWIVDYYRGPFDEIFNSLEKNNGKVIRAAAKEEFLKTKLPDSVLSKIWKLADIDNDGLLDSDEFALAMYLIKIKNEGSELPTTLPNHLLPLSKRVNSTNSISNPIK
ncbi:EH domain-containing protein, N-terminal,EH domain,Dynamin-type guanine nucleotide-binding (G) [Cinara cedri]|uniref:EH domain-containing protein, N-terminal,EH domain,Dynamin-type guanine nucleotide-binding (G) n=1 Tax=Cinara cedri TaxID=506608 RepID=A0A5E4NAD4_9HEMI|nr:EH domain-containing protein, N-terminal,EH domain,Dynamin-type guanine nucleotide-binding (G) [Cinara cedri]